MFVNRVNEGFDSYPSLVSGTLDTSSSLRTSSLPLVDFAVSLFLSSFFLPNLEDRSRVVSHFCH